MAEKLSSNKIFDMALKSYINFSKTHDFIIFSNRKFKKSNCFAF